MSTISANRCRLATVPLLSSLFATSITFLRGTTLFLHSRVHPYFTSLTLQHLLFINTLPLSHPIILCSSTPCLFTPEQVLRHHADARNLPLVKRQSKARFCEDQEPIREDTDHIAKTNKNAQAVLTLRPKHPDSTMTRPNSKKTVDWSSLLPTGASRMRWSS